MLKVATIGFFDGVHKGHQFLFEHLRKEADQRGLMPLIVTFQQHPRVLLQSDYVPQLLTTAEERQALLGAYGEVLMLPFEQIQALTAAEFMTLLRDRYEVSVLLMGYDHRFGADRLHCPQDYRRIGEALGIEVLTMSEYVEGELHVSSTEIRLALEKGNIAVANELLGRPYSLSGTVVHGRAFGRTIGFPTANIQPTDPHKIIPKTGVYMAQIVEREKTALLKDKSMPAFVNIDPQGVIEAHIPSYKGDLYGRQMEIRFERFIREERHFDSAEALRRQIKDDIDNILRPDA